MANCMLAGKLFYHIISTEGHRARQEGDEQHYQQLRNGMHVTLAALADRLQAKLQTPARVEAFKAKVRAALQKVQQRRQQQLHDSVRSADGTMHLPPAAAAGQVQRVKSFAATAPAAADLQQPSGMVTQTAAAQLPAVTDPAAAAAAGTPNSGAPGTSIEPSMQSVSSSKQLAGHKRQHSSSGNGTRWSDDVLWVLHSYCLFHTSWSSRRSPPYNGQLLSQVATELFGPDFKIRSSV
jgi:hypothetical protein